MFSSKSHQLKREAAAQVAADRVTLDEATEPYGKLAADEILAKAAHRERRPIDSPSRRERGTANAAPEEPRATREDQ
jgi:L-rhamnose isomerase